MNENKRINNPQIKVVKFIGTEAQDKKMCWNIIKTNNGNNFQNKNPQLLTWDLYRQKKTFQVHGQNQPVTNLPIVNSCSQLPEMPLTKPLST